MSYVKIAFATILLSLSSWCYSSPWHTVALSSTGILTGGIITLDDAKGIFAINVIVIDSKQNLSRAKVTEFKMTIINDAGERTYSSSTEMLTPEMKEQLQLIRPGDKLYFEYLKTELPDGNRPQVASLGFTIK